MENMCVEWAPFILVPGVGEAALLEASERLQIGFLDNLEGFLKRELLKEKEDHYVDVVWWRSREDAEAVMQTAFKHPICLDYFKLMVPPEGNPGEAVLHFRSIKTYGGR
jgi:hypothetical protein